MITCKDYVCTNEVVQLYLRTVSASSKKFTDAIAAYAETTHVTNPFNYEREVVQETFITPLEFSKNIQGKFDRDLIIGLVQTASVFVNKAFNYYFSSDMADIHHITQEEYTDICARACDALTVISAWIDNADRMFVGHLELFSAPRICCSCEIAAAYEGILARLSVDVLFVALGRFFDCLNMINSDISINRKYSLSDVLELYINTLKYFGVFTPGNLFI